MSTTSMAIFSNPLFASLCTQRFIDREYQFHFIFFSYI